MTRRRKTLSDEDRRLWSHVTAHVTPLDPARQPEPVEEAPTLPAAPAEAQKPVAPPRPAPPGPPPLASLEKGLKRKLARGRAGVEARLDLHGMTQAAAHQRLTAFLHRAQAEGLKLVVVITGKGAPKRLRGFDDDPWRPDAYAERGVLRRVVPQWLALPDMRALVVGFEEAALPHGGAGALYIRIRKRS